MLTSKKWLSQYIDIEDITPAQLADKLTTAGLEVEGLIPMAVGTNLVIGHVLECQMHPNSDHLHVCKVDVGTHIDQIVCGAPNVAAKQKVIVALPGAKLAGGEIKNGTIRGEVSNGMICSLVELSVDPKGLSEESKNGIEILPSDAPVGEEALAYLGLDDTLLDVSLTPNRNDCVASFAFAKEVGAILNRKVKLPQFDKASNLGEKTKLKVSSTTAKCPLFLGKVINKVEIKPSPKWISDLLNAAGVKSINNVVDISNLVMLETGQPTHFYDINKIHQEIVVADGFDCDYTALDGVTYRIQPEDIMITTHNQPIGIAGIMGGDDSKIDETTQGIIIEVATFNHVSCRNTARRLNITSDAAIRNSKEIEPLAPFKAMDRCVQLLVEYANASGIEETAQYGENTYQPTTFTVSVKSINHRLGCEFSGEQMLEKLSALDFSPVMNEDAITVTIPSYRSDIKIEADISEEIIRLIGFDSLPSTLPVMPMTVGALNNRQNMRRKTRTMLTNLGYLEAETYTLVAQRHITEAVLPITPVVELASPMSEDHKYVRNSILPSLLDTVAYNHNRSIKDLSMFEISNVYAKSVVEERIAIVSSGALQKNRWQNLEIQSSFYTLKGLIETLLAQFGFEGTRVMVKENTLDVVHFHPYASAVVMIGKEVFGIFGQIHPAMAKNFEVDAQVMMFEGNMEILLNNKASKVKYEPISKYPAVTRDLALVVNRATPVQTIIDAILKVDRDMIKNVEVFDVYTGEHVDENSKSIALSIMFQSQSQTLTDAQINELHTKIMKTLEDNIQAKLRS